MALEGQNQDGINNSSEDDDELPALTGNETAQELENRARIQTERMNKYLQSDQGRAEDAGQDELAKKIMGGDSNSSEQPKKGE